jgi:hypothetical protein
LAVAPIVIIGHPVSPVVDSPGLGNPIDLSISAKPKPRGLMEALRSGLGGPTRYDVTVVVHNHSTVSLDKIKVYGSAGRKEDNNLAELDLADPGPLPAGQTFSQTVSAVVPAPSFGNVEWSATASGAGPTVTTTASTHHRPTLLIMILMFLIIDIGLLVTRLLVRRHARRAQRAERTDGRRGTARDEGDPIDVDSRELVDSLS